MVEPQRWEVEEVSWFQNHLQRGDLLQGGKPNHIIYCVAEVYLALGMARVQKGVRVEPRPVRGAEKSELLPSVKLGVKVMVAVVVTVGYHVRLSNPDVDGGVRWV